MALPKWTDERTSQLVKSVGEESPVSQETVKSVAEQLETTVKSVAAKLRKMDYIVESSVTAHSKTFTEKQENTLEDFVTSNSGEYTYAQIASAFENGKFDARQIQGKLLSMKLNEHVKPTPKPEVVRAFSDSEEATVVKMTEDGAFLEEIAAAVNKEINSVRGKALSLLKAGKIVAIPKQRDSKGTERKDVFEGVDIQNLTVEEIAEAVEKTPRGVKTMLTRRGLKAKNYDGAAKAAKAAEA